MFSSFFGRTSSTPRSNEVELATFSSAVPSPAAKAEPSSKSGPSSKGSPSTSRKDIEKGDKHVNRARHALMSQVSARTGKDTEALRAESVERDEASLHQELEIMQDGVSRAMTKAKEEKLDQQEKTGTLMGRFKNLFASKPYAWPSSSGHIWKDASGALQSDSPALTRLFEVLNTQPAFRDKVRGLDIPEGQTLNLSVHEDMERCYEDLSAYSEVQEITLKVSKSSNETEKVNVMEKEDETDDNSKEKGLDTSVLTFRNIINKGVGAFKADARPVKRPITEGGHADVHPYEYMAQMVPKASIPGNVELEKLINQEVPKHQDYCARMAASHALQRATRTEYAVLPWAMSVGLSAAAGYLLEIMAGDAALHSLFAKKLREHGLEHVTEEAIIELGSNSEKFAATVIKAYPFLPVEAADTLIVLSALDAIEGAKLTAQKVLKRIPNALKAGGISAVFGLADKATDLIKNIAGRTVTQLITSPVSVMACASGIFFELGEETHKMRAAIRERYDSGDLQWPKKGDPTWPDGVDVNDPKSVEKFITAEAEAMLNLAPKSSIGRSSIPTSILISLATVLAGGLKGHFAPDAVPALMNFLKVIFFNPVEVWTLNINVFFDHQSHDAEFEKERAKIVVQYKKGLSPEQRQQFDEAESAAWDARVAALPAEEVDRQKALRQASRQYEEELPSDIPPIDEGEARQRMMAATFARAANLVPEHNSEVAAASREDIVGSSHPRRFAQLGGGIVNPIYDATAATIGRTLHEGLPKSLNALMGTSINTEDRRLKGLIPWGIEGKSWDVAQETIGIDGVGGIGLGKLQTAN